MLVAVNHSVNELTLLGFVSLCIIALQGPITSICVGSGYFDYDWTILSGVYSEGNCPCCLGDTNGVQQCVLEYAQCGSPEDPMCNCDSQDPACVVNSSDIVVDSVNRENTIAAVDTSNPLKELLAGGAASGAEESYSCVGPVTIDSTGCSEGQIRAVSYLALEQVHLLIFTLSIVHVACGFLLYGIAALRVGWEWGRWEGKEDKHAERVQETLQPYFESLNATLYRRSMTLRRDSMDGSAIRQPEKATIPKQGSCPDGLGEGHPDADEEARGIQNVSSLPSLNKPSAPLPQIVRSDSELKLARRLKRSAKSFRDLVALNRNAWKSMLASARNHFCSVTGWLKTICTHLLLGLGPFLVTKKQYSFLRASFIYTHKMGSGFNFLGHVARSMEEDLSMLVGITPIFWIVTILFWLISGPLGFAIMPAMILNAVVIVGLNVKLYRIIDKVTAKGGSAVRLSTDVFWFNKPQLLLLPMKFCLFMCSFIYASFIFFAWQFSGGSCPFTDGFYPLWVLPWWTIILFNSLIFIHLAAVTFPAYSMAVQMGSDLKSHMLPKRLAKKLLAAVEEAKRHVAMQAKASGADNRQSQFNFLSRSSFKSTTHAAKSSIGEAVKFVVASEVFPTATDAVASEEEEE